MEVEHLALLPHSTATGVSGVRDKNAIAEVFLLCQKDAEACISVSWTAENSLKCPRLWRLG